MISLLNASATWSSLKGEDIFVPRISTSLELGIVIISSKLKILKNFLFQKLHM